MCGCIAQLVAHRSGIFFAEGTGSNPFEGLIFFRLLSNCLSWKIYRHDHSSLSSTTAVQIWIVIYTSHHFTPQGKICTQWVDLDPNVRLHSSVGRASHRYFADFFRLLLSNCLIIIWKIYCDDHSSLSNTVFVPFILTGKVAFTIVFIFYTWTVQMIMRNAFRAFINKTKWTILFTPSPVFGNSY